MTEINLGGALRYARAPSWRVAVDTESRLAAITVGLAANRLYVPRRADYNENVGRDWRPAQHRRQRRKPEHAIGSHQHLARCQEGCPDSRRNRSGHGAPSMSVSPNAAFLTTSAAARHVAAVSELRFASKGHQSEQDVDLRNGST